MPKPDPELLKGVYCPESAAMKLEICGGLSTKEECQKFEECAYDTSSLTLVPDSTTDETLGPCRPAHWVKLMDDGENAKVSILALIILDDA
jgi:hypothetical protein